MDRLRGIPPLILSVPVTEPVPRVSERRDEARRKKRRGPEGAEDAEDEATEVAVPMVGPPEEDAGQHIDTEA